jgi:glycosyltransferase involved in cell wall biosynthesis
MQQSARARASKPPALEVASSQRQHLSPCGPAPDVEERAVEISIVMPCLNERETILECVKEAKEAIEAAGVRGEIVVADNGSTDGSQAVAERAGARVVAVPSKGYGNALMGGIAAASGTYVLMGDADGSYDFRELPRFLAKLRAGADLIMGCRLPSGGGTILPGAMPWKHRWIGTPVLSSIGRLFFYAPVNDFPLRPARVSTGRHPGPRLAVHGHGVRLRNGGQEHARRVEDRSGADHASP